MFDAYPTHDRYRPLRECDPALAGPDAYALQLALNYLGDFAIPLVIDGVFGRKSARALAAVQRRLGVEDDAIAGPHTQAAIAKRLAKQLKGELPPGLPGGQIAFESGFIFGNYSAQRSNGSYDAGICQRNTHYTPAERGFDPIESIATLVAATEHYYVAFDGLGERRRWELAAGAWNAPAYACWFARREGAGGISASQTAQPSPAAAETFAAYIAHATAYLRV